MNIPFYKQKTGWTCGAAAMRMVLASLGIKKSEEQLTTQLSIGHQNKWWTKNASMPKVAEIYRLNYVVRRNASVDNLRRLLKEGYRIIVNYFYLPEGYGHFAVVKKIDKKYIYLLDPLVGPNHKIDLKKFAGIWKGDIRSDGEIKWFIAIKK